MQGLPQEDSPEMTTARRLQRRHSAPELAAAALRERVLSGELGEGDELPKIEHLAAQLRMSKPAVREACLILETEGLIQVRRGNVGGSVVRRPTHHQMAYSLGLVLQATHTELTEVREAIALFEPIAAGLCAGRRDRRRVVLPRLDEHHTAYAHALEADDPTAAIAAARRWHETIAATCGNEAVSATLGMLEHLWTSNVRENANRRLADGQRSSPRHSRAVLDDHRRIQELIAAGDVDGASDAARRHLHRARVLPARRDEGRIPVRADLVHTENDRPDPAELY